MAIIYVDADACPKQIKEIIYRFAQKNMIECFLVANQPLQKPNSKWIKSLLVDKGFDIADNHIIEKAEKNDLVITADIPLAADIVKKGAIAINPKGVWYDTKNINAVLTMRNFMTEMRESGMSTCYNKPFNHQQSHDFANLLEKYNKLLKAYDIK